MLDFPSWKKLLCYFVCLLGILFALPNFLPTSVAEKLQNFGFKTVNLGLDLKGGSHLLIEVDHKQYIADQLSLSLDELKKLLRQEKIGYVGTRIVGDEIEFNLRLPEQVNEVRSILRKQMAGFEFVQDDMKFILKMTDAAMQDHNAKVVDQSIEIVRRRVDETGTKEPSIQRQGDKYILLQVPGLQDPSQLKSMLGKTAKLTFHLVDNSGSYSTSDPNVMILEYDGDSSGVKSKIAVKRKVVVSGDMLTDAQASYVDGMPVVTFKFNSFGGRNFGEATKANVGQRLAIVLDNKVISAPNINQPILSGSGYISGSFTVEAANELALLLRAGALPAPLKIVEERTVGPSLGQDSINSGKVAGIAASIFVVGFMLLVYLRFGLFANIALCFNMIFILAIMSILQATLTLPGIAGIILTLGMAVDANVLIFERIREETKNGLSPFAATDLGFRHAFRTITDSNITTFIVAFILYQYGTGPVRGFAVTLSIGIAASMFSAILLTRLMIVEWLKSARPKGLNL